MKPFKVIFLLLAIGGVCIFGYLKYINYQKELIIQLEDKIALLKEEHIPIRFKISEKTKDSIKFVIKFYNADNKEINQLKSSYPGQELSIDFYVVPIKDKYVAFPSKVFSNLVAASDGIQLYDLYNHDGFPEIFDSKNLNQDLRIGLKNLFEHIKTNQVDSINQHFGNMVHDIQGLKSYMPDIIYSIVCHSKGGIEIQEE